MAELSGKTLFSIKTVCIVIGASRGIGRSIVVNFASKFPSGSLVVALARDSEQLAVTKTLSTQASPGVACVTSVFDQGSLDQDQYDTWLKDCLQVGTTSYLNRTDCKKRLTFSHNIDVSYNYSWGDCEQTSQRYLNCPRAQGLSEVTRYFRQHVT